MPTSLFKITPTPSDPIKLKPGEEGKLSFTVESLAAPDRVQEVMVQALLVGEDGKGKEADWLIAGPKPTLSMSGGETETVTITVRPKPTSPRGEHKIKLVIADKERPNDLYADSQAVTCEVLPPSVTPPPPHRRWWLIPVIAGGLLVVGGGVLLVWRLLQPDAPVAAASGEPLAGRVPLTVTFKDSSTGAPTRVEWSFGDGSPVSELSNPSHTYTKPGTYTVELTARNKRGASTAQIVVKAEVPLPPTAVAAGEPLAGRVPLTVKLQNKSTGNPSRVEWNFGDGSPISTEDSPSHRYETPKTYTVTLTAKDPYGGATTAKLTVKAEQPSGPVAVAAGEPLTGRVPLTVNFQDKTAGNPRRVEWNFGDGSPISREGSPSHKYEKPGTYTVTLTAWDSFGASGSARLTVKADPPPPPVAVALGDPLAGRIPLIVRFQNRSTGNPSKVEWNFGDGTLISEDNNPVHTYTKAGTYTVQLTARDTYGGSTTARLVVKAEAPPPGPVAEFQPSVEEGKWPLEVSFSDRSKNAIPGTQWAWSFGDGKTSTERSPQHRFEEPKDYTVRLRVSNPNGSSASERIIHVLSRTGELHPQHVGPFGGTWGVWAGQFQKCPGQTLAYGFADKDEPSQGGGDDTALNGIKLWCVDLPDLQSNNYITSDVAQWGNWSDRLDCGDRKSYITGARLRIEAPLGAGDDTGAVNVEFSCSNGTILRNGGHDWGAWRDWRYCPANTAICGIKTRIERPQGGGDDTALNDVEFQCCYAK